MSLLKSALRTDIVRRGLCVLAALYVRVVRAASRWRVEGGAIPEALWRQRKPFILAFWHGRLLMIPYCWPRSVRIDMLISGHPDGQLIHGAIGQMGLGVIVGSTRHGGARAMRAVLKTLKRGDCVGLTPDGPRGPRMRAAAGVIDIARLTGAPIVPAAYAASRRRVLGTWDRFVVALPFSRGVYVWGEPIAVSRGVDAAGRAAARRVLVERLTAGPRAADRRVGRHPIEPAPASAAVSRR